MSCGGGGAIAASHWAGPGPNAGWRARGGGGVEILLCEVQPPVAEEWRPDGGCLRKSWRKLRGKVVDI